MYNKVVLIGNLTADPELRYTPQGTPLCNLRIAVNTRYKKDGENQEEVLFIGVTVWGKQGESCSQYLSKGRPVLVEGRLQEQRWTTDEGQQRSKMVVIAQNVRFLGKKDDGAAHGAQDQRESYPPDEQTDMEPF